MDSGRAWCPWPRDLGSVHCSLFDYADAVNLDKNAATLHGVATGIEFVAVEPHPPVVGRPVVDSDHAKVEGFFELDACLTGEAEDVS